MKEREELELILKLIGKYNLPLSPILEYAIKEKIEEYPSLETPKDDIIEESIDKSAYESTAPLQPSGDNNKLIVIPSEGVKIVEYGPRSFAIIGNSRQYKSDLRAMGGYFTYRTMWGPAWVFSEKKRNQVEAYLKGDTSVVYSWKTTKDKDKQKEEYPSKHKIIRVEYPDGRVITNNHVYQTLIDVIKYADPQKVHDLNIICMGENLVSETLNDNRTYRAAQKEIGNGLYVSTYSSTDIKYKQIQKINASLHLGLKVEIVMSDGSEIIESNITHTDQYYDSIEDKEKKNANPSSKDKRIGYKVRLFPSQFVGEIVDVRVGKSGLKKLVVVNKKGEIKEIDDTPYLYEVLKKK